MSKHPLAERVVEDLRVEVFRSGLSQQRLAEAVESSSAWVQRRLAGDVEPTLSDIANIADAAGLDVEVSLLRRATPIAVTPTLIPAPPSSGGGSLSSPETPGRVSGDAA